MESHLWQRHGIAIVIDCRQLIILTCCRADGLADFTFTNMICIRHVIIELTQRLFNTIVQVGGSFGGLREFSSVWQGFECPAALRPHSSVCSASANFHGVSALDEIGASGGVARSGAARWLVARIRPLQLPSSRLWQVTPWRWQMGGRQPRPSSCSKHESCRNACHRLSTPPAPMCTASM